MRAVLIGLVLCLGISVWGSTLTDFTPVMKDLQALYSNSQAFWPADFSYYGPFFVRLAWHCTGSYRISDGRGGCDGGRQRFDPERSWDDNTNLDKARRLLVPIKLKYGDSLSWGDLMVLAGTTAIGDMGGPVLGFCGGRVDDSDGTDSMELGPTTIQSELFPCNVTGNCTSPIGTTTIGLIYVNPEGPFGNPDPSGSAPQVRDTFKRMAMNDSETVALIGGGHAFGKTHGACTGGPGPAPDVQPNNPWPGTCGSGSMFGKGNNTYTSGFEGPWTSTPTKWSNEYFYNLLYYNWTTMLGPGGKYQWTNNITGTMMLTSDISLINDSNFHYWVQDYHTSISNLENAFSHAWYKLTARDMGPVTRCIGNNVPSAQPFQYPLPSSPSTLVNFTIVRSLLTTALNSASSNMIPELVHLTFQSCSTFRKTDYLGGCNGARIRYYNGSVWSVNYGTETTIAWLKTNVMDQLSKYTTTTTLSYSDLIVLAGQVAVESAGGNSMTFCSGRTDATYNDGGWDYLAPRSYNTTDPTTVLLNVKDLNLVSGLTYRQWVVLQARPRSATTQQWMGYSGSWTSNPSILSNAYFNVLLNYTWAFSMSSSGLTEFMANEKSGVYMMPSDMALIWDAEYLALVQEYASNNTLFLADFMNAWNQMVIFDRFNGPSGNLCNYTVSSASTTTTNSGSSSSGTTSSSSAAVIVLAILLGLAVIGLMYCVYLWQCKRPADDRTVPLTKYA